MNEENLTELEGRILVQLATPGKTKTEIAADLGFSHPGRVNKQMMRLSKRGLITVASTHKVKGNEVQRWRLTDDGVDRAQALGASTKTLLKQYGGYYPHLAQLKQIDGIFIKGFKFWDNDRDQIMREMLTVLKVLREGGVIDESVQRSALSGVLESYFKRRQPTREEFERALPALKAFLGQLGNGYLFKT